MKGGTGTERNRDGMEESIRIDVNSAGRRAADAG
jgi:hypothetical protein